MLLNFIDVFRFFTEVPLTSQQRLYELWCVSAVSIVTLCAAALIIVKNIRDKKRNKESRNDADEKSGN